MCRLWLGIFGAAFLVLGALVATTVATPTPVGDLTRVAMVSERAFGWSSVPPPIALEDARVAPIEQADILVIGDSFSTFLAWQSVLVAAGLRVTTTTWDALGPLCEDFGTWVQRAGFMGKLVVIESVERSLPGYIETSRGCAMTHAVLRPLKTATTSPSRPYPGFRPSLEGKLLSGVQTYLNTRSIAKAKSPTMVNHSRIGDSIYASPVPDGCVQFSHSLCDKGLFVEHDRTLRELTVDDANWLDRFRSQAAPFQVVWMVVPNKSTVYLEPNRASAFVARANALRLGPDLFALAQSKRRSVVDLYWPNDTHWSMQGQVIFGRQILDWLRDSVPARGGATS